LELPEKNERRAFPKGTPLSENQCFEDIVSKYEPIIKHQIKKLRIYKEHEIFYQIGLIGLWEAMKEHDPAKGTFQTLAITKVRGKMLDQLKKEKLYEERYTQIDMQHYDHIPANNLSERGILETETIASYCIGLSHEQYLWVQKAIVEQKKVGEIAAELNVPVERVKSWRKQAIKKIRRNIKGW
jgi:RNA polymerase sigma factor (sigma-70 family)